MSERIAVVTGASRGLGRSAASQLARRGVQVLGTYRSSAGEAGSLVRAIEAEGGRAAMTQPDLNDMASVRSFAASLPGLLDSAFGRRTFDFLVNNGGSSVTAAFADTSEAQLDEMMQVHVESPYLMTQALLPHIVDGGAIVNVTSGFSRFTLPDCSAYGVAKCALEALTRFLALELGPRRIRVNALAPGAIATDIGGGAVKNDPAVASFLSSTIALGRVGQPDDAGRAIAALLSDDLAWASGARIEVSGGQMI